MRLSRWSSILPLAIAFASCTSTVDPNAVPGAYGLHDINGRALPTFQAATPGSLTVRSGGLSLDFNGTAQLIQSLSQGDGTERTDTLNFTYQIKGHELIFQFSQACPADANCISPPTGRIAEHSFINVNMGSVDNVPIVYNFQRITLAY
jgi:hypothetical protein